MTSVENIIPYFNLIFLAFFTIGSVLILFLRIIGQRIFYNLVIYRILIFLSFIFWLEHYRWIITTKAGWGNDSTTSIPGLQLFTLVSPFLATFILLIATVLAKYLPKLTALTPIILLGLTWFGTLKILFWKAPYDFSIADNMPQVWLFISSFVVTSSLLLFSLLLRSFRFTRQYETIKKAAEEKFSKI